MNAPQNINLADEQLYNSSKSPSEAGSNSRCSEDNDLALDPFFGMFKVSYPYFFLAMAGLTLHLYHWSYHWWLSGAPLLCFSLMVTNIGPVKDSTVFLVASLLYVNITYALSSTSWLFFAFYRIIAFPSIFIVMFSSNRRTQKLTRRALRAVLRSFHFSDDKFAFFDLPALDIDTGEVPCLLVIRGFTFTLSTMTLEIHGVEVGVKLNDDMELAIQTESFVWRMMRDIRIGDVYGNLKTGPGSHSKPRIKRRQSEENAHHSMTKNNTPRTMNATESAGSKVTLHGNYDEEARRNYETRLSDLEASNTSIQARNEVKVEISSENKIKAAIGSRLHDMKTVPNPPKDKMKASDLEARVPWILKEIFRKIPVLLRLFLNPVSYAHPVHFESIVLSGCGKYLNSMLDERFFKQYHTENTEIRKLKAQVEEFLNTGKFNVVLPRILGLASVPFLTHYDIITFIKVPQVLIYKTLQEGEGGEEVEEVEEAAEIKGLAATFTIPSALLPNHEHLLPDPPRDTHKRDCLNVKMSILGSLPGKFNPAMVDFAVTMLKASQVLTLHKNANSMSEEVESFTDFSKSLGKAAKEQTKKKLVQAHVNDSWLNKLILKGVDAIRTAKGDIGYQMDIPVDLVDLRPRTFVRRSGKSDDERRADTLAEATAAAADDLGSRRSSASHASTIGS